MHKGAVDDYSQEGTAPADRARDRENVQDLGVAYKLTVRRLNSRECCNHLAESVKLTESKK